MVDIAIATTVTFNLGFSVDTPRLTNKQFYGPAQVP